MFLTMIGLLKAEVFYWHVTNFIRFFACKKSVHVSCSRVSICSSLQYLCFNWNPFFSFISEAILLATRIMATYGKIGESEPSVKRWDNCIEWVDEFFIANGINDNTKKKTILLSSFGAKTNQLLRGLSDNQPSMKTYTQLVTQMKKSLVSGTERHS